MSEILKLRDDCVFVAVSDEGLILDTKTGAYYTVTSDEGIFLMGPITAGVELENLQKAFQAKFPDLARAGDDFARFIGELKQNQLLDPQAKEAGIQMLPGKPVSSGFYFPPKLKAKGRPISRYWGPRIEEKALIVGRPAIKR